MEYPSLMDYLEFNEFTSEYKSKYSKNHAKSCYLQTIKYYPNPEDAVFGFSEDKHVASPKIVLFLIMKLKIKVSGQFLPIIYHPDKALKYFNLVDNDFWEAYSTIYKTKEKRNVLLVYIIHVLVVLQKNNIKDITHEDIVSLNQLNLRYTNFRPMLEKIVDRITLREDPPGIRVPPNRPRTEKKYGTQNKNLLNSNSMGYPSLKDYLEFDNYITEKTSSVYYAKYCYLETMYTFPNPEEAVFNLDIGRRFPSPRVVLFLILTLKIKVTSRYLPIIRHPEKILKYFNLVDDNFWGVYQSLLKGSTRRKTKFLAYVIQVLIILQKNSIRGITHEDIIMLNQFDLAYTASESFGPMLEKVIDRITLRAYPVMTKFPRKQHEPEKKYGTLSENLVHYIELYLDEQYILKGRIIDSPRQAIKVFFLWLNQQYKNIDNIEKIEPDHWNRYRIHIMNLADYSERTKQVRIHMVLLFFEWLYRENHIKQKIVDYSDRYKGNVKTQPRMFKSRDHFKIILKALLDYQPVNDEEELVRHFIIVVSATGLRVGEARWIGPNCLVSQNSEAGEILLQIREKLGVQHKITSVLQWGLESINLLNDRFQKGNKIKFFHKRSGEYYYSLFEFNGKLLTDFSVYTVLNKIINDLDLQDNNGNRINLNHKKFHAFRHQKFNDIYDVTGGSVTSVKIDSGHLSIGMAKVYTQQQEENRQIEAMKLISEGKIVGKGSKILKSLLETPFSAESYLNIVQKLNLQTLRDNKPINYLGFGFCGAEKCSVAPLCEECDYFYSCSTFIEDLKERYYKNFTLLQAEIARIGEETMLENTKSLEIIKSLKWQEKWLLELGLNIEEIKTLRYMNNEVN